MPSGWKVGDPGSGFPVPGSCRACRFRAASRDPGSEASPRAAGVPVAAPRASVSASDRWGGPSAPRRGAGHPAAPLRPPARLLGAGLSHPRGPCAPGQGAGPSPPGRVSPKRREDGVGHCPSRDRVAAHLRRAGDKLDYGTRGKSEAGTWASRARPPPHLPATCTGALCTGAPAGSGARTGRGSAAWSWGPGGGRPLSALGRPQGAFHVVTVRGSAACSFGPIQVLGGDRGSGPRDAFRPPGCESLCKPFIVTVIFARMSHPGGRDVVVVF